MTAKPFLVLMLAAAAVLSACEKSDDTYPVTGEQCGPSDPVKELDAEDCYIPPAGL